MTHKKWDFEKWEFNVSCCCYVSLHLINLNYSKKMLGCFNFFVTGSLPNIFCTHNRCALCMFCNRRYSGLCCKPQNTRTLWGQRPNPRTVLGLALNKFQPQNVTSAIFAMETSIPDHFSHPRKLEYVLQLANGNAWRYSTLLKFVSDMLGIILCLIQWKQHYLSALWACR